MIERVVWAPDEPHQPGSYSEILASAGAATGRFATFTRFDGREVYLKAAHLRAKQRAMGFFRGAGPWRQAPRLVEFHNLLRLRQLGLPAVRPIVAGEVRSWGLLQSQFLMTERVPDATDIYHLLVRNELPPPSLSLLLARIGILIGQLHNHGFCHRDLFPRNIIHSPGAGGGNLHVLDCHKGSWSRWRLKDETYDLACFDKWANTLVEPEHRCDFYAGYAIVRPASMRRDFLDRVDRRRRSLVRRFSHKKRAAHRAPWLMPRLDAPTLHPDDLERRAHALSRRSDLAPFLLPPAGAARENAPSLRPAFRSP